MHLDHSEAFPRQHTHSAEALRPDGNRRALRVGLGGPVGSGKTATVAALCRTLRDRWCIAAVTNDIYTREDAEYLLREAVLPPERITAVETGACPHTAIRDDISANLEAVEHLEETLHPLDLVLVESGGDNLTATFSKGLVDVQIFIIDVSSGDDIPRKGAPASPAPTSSSSTRPISPRTSAPTWTPWPSTPQGSAASCLSSSPTSPPTTGSGTSPTGSPPTSPSGTPRQVRCEHRRPTRRRPLPRGLPRPGARRIPARRTGHSQDPRRAQRTRHHPPAAAQRRPLPLAAPAHRRPRRHRGNHRRNERPLGGDRLTLDITAEDRAELEVTTAAATLALRGPTSDPATYDVCLTVGEHAYLRWLPKPLISAAGSNLRQTYSIELAATARLFLREEQLLGRAGEEPGHLVSRLLAHRAGHPLLDQHTAYRSPEPGWDGPAILGGHRATGQLLVVDPRLDTRRDPLLLGGGSREGCAVLTPLAGGPAVLATAVAPTSSALRELLDEAQSRILVS